MSLPGVILAAGRSSRMGRDKALLELDGETFLNRLVDVFLTALDPVVVVLGHHSETIAATLRKDPRLRVELNRQYALGMLSSLQTGLRAIPAGSPGAVFTLVDHPRLRRPTLAAVAGALAEETSDVVIPRYAGERGHPVGISAVVIDALLALDPTDSPKSVIRSRRARTRFLDLDDPSIVEDIDRPEQYRDAAG